MRKTILISIIAVLCTFIVFSAQADRRKYQHGIDFIPLLDGNYFLLWSSSPGSPPQGDKKVVLASGRKCNYFTHDVYYSYINRSQPKIEQQLLISLPEAQEPVSAAISATGQIALSMEDGSDSDITSNCNGIIQQRYQIFNSRLQAMTDLRRVSVKGAHSGHITAVGKQFVIFYSEGWIPGGGVNNLGTGSDVMLDVVDTQGKIIFHRDIAIDNGFPRDWWPLVAGSDSHAILLWQRYVKNNNLAKLMYSVYKPSTDTLVKNTTLLKNNIYYYHYDVQYLANINRFLIVGNYLGEMLLPENKTQIVAKTQKGFAFLMDNHGNIVDQWSASHKCNLCGSYHTHPFVREAQPAIAQQENEVRVLYPVKPKGALLFAVTPSKITLKRHVPGDYYWQSLGTDGIFLDNNKAYFATLSPTGIVTETLQIN